MNDTYIIDLFWKRDENAIKMVDEKYNSFCYSMEDSHKPGRFRRMRKRYMVCGMEVYTS